MEISYTLEYKDKALEDIRFFKHLGDAKIISKINVLLDELEAHPTVGTGKPEKLKSNLSGYMSRRINREHRLLYRIDELNKIVTIVSMKGHY